VRTEFHQRADIKTSKIPDPLWLDARRLVTDCLSDVERQKVISIPSKRYQALILAARLAPRTAVRAVSRKLSSGRH
jgi:short-subunit dehydrogenase